SDEPFAGGRNLQRAIDTVNASVPVLLRLFFLVEDLEPEPRPPRADGRRGFEPEGHWYSHRYVRLWDERQQGCGECRDDETERDAEPHEAQDHADERRDRPSADSPRSEERRVGQECR